MYIYTVIHYFPCLISFPIIFILYKKSLLFPSFFASFFLSRLLVLSTYLFCFVLLFCFQQLSLFPFHLIPFTSSSFSYLSNSSSFSFLLSSLQNLPVNFPLSSYLKGYRIFIPRGNIWTGSSRNYRTKLHEVFHTATEKDFFHRPQKRKIHSSYFFVLLLRRFSKWKKIRLRWMSRKMVLP